MSTNTPAAEADRVLALLRPGPLSTDEYKEYTAIYGRDPAAVTQHAQALLMRAQLEEQRTANKIAAYQAELIVNPYGVGTREHDKWWVDFGTPITEAVGA